MLSYNQGTRRRRIRHDNALEHYSKKHSSKEYMKFISDNSDGFSISEVGKQNENHQEFMCLFTIVSQHVYGDCLAECLDKAIAKSLPIIKL